MKYNFELKAQGPVSLAFLARGVTDFETALTAIRLLPYRRNKDKTNLLTVLTDGHGTCSTKHALLRQLAREHGMEQIKLVMGLFKMNAVNTPEVAATLAANQLGYIPEAHCYLKMDAERVDVTKAHADPVHFVDDLLEETEIEPQQITDFKVAYHKRYLHNWLEQHPAIALPFDKLWSVREQCIRDMDSY